MTGVTFKKCPCGHPVCKQYILSTQGSQGFSIEDARLYAAAPDLLEVLRLIRATLVATNVTERELMLQIDLVIEKVQYGTPKGKSND